MKTMSIYEAITVGTTVKNSTKARVNADKVGVDIFPKWRVAENAAFEAFYRYADARRKAAAMGEAATIDKDISDKAFAALRELLNLIGEVNGHKLYANDAMLNTVAALSMVAKKPLAGEAFTQESVVANLRKQVNGIKNGMDAAYVENITRQFEEAKIRLAELKKLEGSCKVEYTRVNANKFYLELENALATIINIQDATPWEVLEKEEAERKAARKAARKANKDSKK